MKRTRELYEDSKTAGKRICALCSKALWNENENSEDDVHCSKCKRQFHLECSGIQEGWANFVALTCEQFGLDCKQTSGMVKPTSNENTAEIPSMAKKSKEKSKNTILNWVVVKRGQSDRKRKRFKTSAAWTTRNKDVKGKRTIRLCVEEIIDGQNESNLADAADRLNLSSSQMKLTDSLNRAKGFASKLKRIAVGKSLVSIPQTKTCEPQIVGSERNLASPVMSSPCTQSPTSGSLGDNMDHSGAIAWSPDKSLSAKDEHTGLTQEMECLDLSESADTLTLSQDDQLINNTDELEQMRAGGDTKLATNTRMLQRSRPYKDKCESLCRSDTFARKASLNEEKSKLESVRRLEEEVKPRISQSNGDFNVNEESFAEIRLNREYVKVEVIAKDGSLVRRVEGGPVFSVDPEDLERYGSNDPESSAETTRRVEFELMEQLFAEGGLSIEVMEKDGNCLYRSVARLLYGDSEQHGEVRVRTVDYIIGHKESFSGFDINIDERLSEQLLTTTWGGHIELSAISRLYNVDIKVWELSKSGGLTATCVRAPSLASRSKTLNLSRHYKNHYNCLIPDNQLLPVLSPVFLINEDDNGETKDTSGMNENNLHKSCEGMIWEDGGAPQISRLKGEEFVLIEDDKEMDIDYLEKESDQLLFSAMDMYRPEGHATQLTNIEEETYMVIDGVTSEHSLGPKQKGVNGNVGEIFGVKHPSKSEINSVQPNSQLLNPGRFQWHLKKKESHSPERCKRNSKAKIKRKIKKPGANSAAPDPSQHIEDGNIWCPIPGCSNWGGRGYRRSNGISKHLKGQHAEDHKKSSPNFPIVSSLLESLERRICLTCSRITKRCTAEGHCEKCDVKAPNPNKVTQELTQEQRSRWANDIMKIQQTKFMLRKTVPRRLCSVWSDIVTDISLSMVDAKTEKEALRAFRRYLMLKSVLITPLRGGGGNKNRNHNLTEKLMKAFYKGKEDEVWIMAEQIENSRQVKRLKQEKARAKKRKRNGSIISNGKGKTKWKYERAKTLTNDGEISKAHATIVNRGVATLTDDIVKQLKEKFPARARKVKWPKKERILELRRLMESKVGLCSESVKENMGSISSVTETSMDIDESSSILTALQESSEFDFQSITVNWENIVQTASKAKKSTGGGLCQLTPWHLKAAVSNSPGNRCAKALAWWANRWARGDFDTHLGALLAMSRLLPIYKDLKTDDVRPVACGSAVRRLLGKCLGEKIRKRVGELTKEHQLGLKRTGYEIGVHAARSLAEKCKRNGHAMLLLDFENAYNRADRALLLEIAIAVVPEAGQALWWFYERETELVTDRGDRIKCSTGVMQGCPFASLAFSLIIKWLVAQLTHKELDAKLFFMDDGMLCGTPAALSWSLDLINGLEPISGLFLKYSKMDAHAPNAVAAEECRRLLPEGVEVHHNEEMNFVWLKAPIGSDKFVKEQLECKLRVLQGEVEMVSEFPHLHECFTLLRSCTSSCKVTHLMRTIPSTQLEQFLKGFDNSLKKAMEKILGHTLNTKQWLVCQLPTKYGGLGLRSGKLIAGAQHVMSLEKCAEEMKAHAPKWNLIETAKKASGGWLVDCLGEEFNLTSWLTRDSEDNPQKLGDKTGSCPYKMSLAQRCEWQWYQRISKDMTDNERTRLLANSGPTQSWVTSLPLGYKNYNLSSTEWLIGARRRLGLDLRTKRSRCPNCRYHEICRKGDHALRCSGKMGRIMRHDAIKNLLARAFKQSGFDVETETGGGLLDRRRPGDVEVHDWLLVRNWNLETSFCIDVAVIDATGDNHIDCLRKGGPGAAATKYESVKWKEYKDIKRKFVPFILEAQGGFGKEAKKLVKELWKRKRERECVPNTRIWNEDEPMANMELVKAIGFELVRRNARMIQDRTPKYETLIPAERTRIRFEILRSKERVGLEDISPHDNPESPTKRMQPECSETAKKESSDMEKNSSRIYSSSPIVHSLPTPEESEKSQNYMLEKVDAKRNCTYLPGVRSANSCTDSKTEWHKIFEKKSDTIDRCRLLVKRDGSLDDQSNNVSKERRPSPKPPDSVEEKEEDPIEIPVQQKIAITTQKPWKYRNPKSPTSLTPKISLNKAIQGADFQLTKQSSSKTDSDEQLISGMPNSAQHQTNAYNGKRKGDAKISPYRSAPTLLKRHGNTNEGLITFRNSNGWKTESYSERFIIRPQTAENLKPLLDARRGKKQESETSSASISKSENYLAEIDTRQDYINEVPPDNEEITGDFGNSDILNAESKVSNQIPKNNPRWENTNAELTTTAEVTGENRPENEGLSQKVTKKDKQLNKSPGLQEQKQQNHPIEILSTVTEKPINCGNEKIEIDATTKLYKSASNLFRKFSQPEHSISGNPKVRPNDRNDHLNSRINIEKGYAFLRSDKKAQSCGTGIAEVFRSKEMQRGEVSKVNYRNNEVKAEYKENEKTSDSEDSGFRAKTPKSNLIVKCSTEVKMEGLERNKSPQVVSKSVRGFQCGSGFKNQFMRQKRLSQSQNLSRPNNQSQKVKPYRSCSTYYSSTKSSQQGATAEPTEIPSSPNQPLKTIGGLRAVLPRIEE